MKKSIIAAAVTLSLGIANTADALTMNITSFSFGATNGATGSFDSSPGGTATSTSTFFGLHWTAYAVAFFSGAGSHTWSDTGNINGSFSYNFSLTSNQVAWGVLWDWSLTSEVPLLNIMTCASGFTSGSAFVLV